VPLTHRDHADSVRFVTGHSRKDSEPLTARQRKQPQAQEAGADAAVGAGRAPADGAARAVEAARAEARAVARRAGPLAAADDSPPPPLDLDFEK
jgi:siroheme synthase